MLIYQKKNDLVHSEFPGNGGMLSNYWKLTGGALVLRIGVILFRMV